MRDLEQFVVWLFLLAACFPVDHIDGKFQVTDLSGVKCLVSGQPASLRYSVDFKRGQIYFDCNSSRVKFLADPKRFTRKANHQLVVTAQYVQASCPIRQTEITAGSNPSMLVAGVRFRFCCEHCLSEFRSQIGHSPGQKLTSATQLFDDDSFKRLFRPRGQATGPIDGNAVRKDLSPAIAQPTRH